MTRPSLRFPLLMLTSCLCFMCSPLVGREDQGGTADRAPWPCWWFGVGGLQSKRTARAALLLCSPPTPNHQHGQGARSAVPPWSSRPTRGEHMKHKQLVSISKGNRKLGLVMNISTTPGRCCIRGVPCVRDGCYAFKALRLYKCTRTAWHRNELLAKHHPDSYFMQSA